MSETRKVLVSEELFQHLGATKVDWGEPDEEGFYTPTIYMSTESRIRLLEQMLTRWLYANSSPYEDLAQLHRDTALLLEGT